MVIKRKIPLSGRRKVGDDWGTKRQVTGMDKGVGE